MTADDTASAGEGFLEVLRRHWADVLSRADPQQRARLIALASGAGDEDDIDRQTDLADELLDLLPPDHPVVDAMRGTVMFSAGMDPDHLHTLLEHLRQTADPAPDVIDLRTQPDDAGGPDDQDEPDDPDDPDLDHFDAVVRGDLRSYPALDASQLPDDEFLRLPAEGRGQPQVPAFQLDPAGRLRPVVRQINVMLDAAADPWGVMCWWVHPHARLPAAPADLLGVDDELLLRAARAVIED